MIAFNVQGMTCGHCVNALTKAVRQADGKATVSVNLDTKRVQISSPQVDAKVLKAAIEEAGYRAEEVSSETPSAVARRSGCCGSCQ